MGALESLVRPEWPPMTHVRRGWSSLDPAEQAEVAQRVQAVLAEHRWGPHPKDALLPFFAFLAQVETIAIEIPLRFLPHAPAKVQPLLRRQLVDEVFHSTLFSRLAHELALPDSVPPPPLASAERLLQRIRDEPDLAITATMLNLVAEGWIETLFAHALKWGIAPAVFKAVLADEARHVHEAKDYMDGLDAARAQAAVAAFEQGMAEVGAEPTVALAIHALAGEAGQRALASKLHRQHARNLRSAGLQPSKEWLDAARVAEDVARRADPAKNPTVVDDTHWRRMARQVWQTPRDPTMQGDFDVPVGHIPRKLLTPVLIAALGRAWAKHPELNRIVARDQVWQLPYANVGVRVLLDDDELATVLIPEADKRSPRDIQRMLQDGIAQLKASHATRPAPPKVDVRAAALAPATPGMFAVALSNAGKWGVISGAGSLSGWLSPSTDITVGLRRRLPRWRGIAYLPSWHVNVAAVQDHRVLDGRASATAVRAIQDALSPAAVHAILHTPDTIPSDAELDSQSKRVDWANVPAGAAPTGAVLGAIWLPKYTPFVIGGLGLGALLGLGGYLLYQQYAVPAAASALANPAGQAGATQGTAMKPLGGPAAPAVAGKTKPAPRVAAPKTGAPAVPTVTPPRAPPTKSGKSAAPRPPTPAPVPPQAPRTPARAPGTAAARSPPPPSQLRDLHSKVDALPDPKALTKRGSSGPVAGKPSKAAAKRAPAKKAGGGKAAPGKSGAKAGGRGK